MKKVKKQSKPKPLIRLEPTLGLGRLLAKAGIKYQSKKRPRR